MHHWQLMHQTSISKNSVPLTSDQMFCAASGNQRASNASTAMAAHEGAITFATPTQYGLWT